MQPGEGSSPLPPRGRPPLSRNRGAADGMLDPVSRRPAMSPRYAPRQITASPPAPVAPSPAPFTTPEAAPSSSIPTAPIASSEAPQQIPQPSLPKPARKIPGKVIAGVVLFLVVLLLGGGAYSFLSWQTKQRDPLLLLQDGLEHSLSVKKLEVETTTSVLDTHAQLDFTDTNSPIVATQSTLKRYGSTFGLSGYGAKNASYISYTSLPTAVSSSLVNSARDSWVQLYDKTVPVNLDHQLANLADPHYQAFGPVITGNFTPAVRQQLTKFLLDHQVYKITTKTASATELAGKKAYVLPVTLDVGFLKVAVQSAAANEGMTPQAVQAAVNALDSYKAAKTMLYISSKGHNIVRLTSEHAGSTQVVSYSKFNTATVPGEPQTHVTWQNFAPLEWQIEAQAASRMPAASLDVERKADLDALHAALASYFAQNSYFPTLASMNDFSWLTSIANADAGWQRDPLATTETLATAAKAGTYVYIAIPASGKGTCDAKNTCQHYKLVATLSSGQQYSVQDP